MGQLTKNEKLTFNLTLGNIVATILLGIFSLIQDNKIAKLSGAFDKPIPDIFIGNFVLKPDNEYDVYLGLVEDLNEQVISMLPISIKNSGQKNLENIEFSMTYLDLPKIAVSEKNLGNQKDDNSNFKRKSTIDDIVDKINFSKDIIYPNSFGYIDEYILHPKIPNKTKTDSRNNAIPISNRFRVRIEMTAKDQRTQHNVFNIYFIDRKSSDDLIKAVVLHNHFTKGIEPERKRAIVMTPNLFGELKNGNKSYKILNYLGDKMIVGFTDQFEDNFTIFDYNDKYLRTVTFADIQH